MDFEIKPYLSEEATFLFLYMFTNTGRTEIGLHIQFCITTLFYLLLSSSFILSKSK